MKSRETQLNSEVISLAKELIAIPSTADKPKELDRALKIAENYCQGFAIKRFSSQGKPSLLITNGKPSDRFKLIFNAHLDVVPAKSPQFKPQVKGDKLIGRGAVDMKTQAAVGIVVFKRVAKSVNYPLALQLVADEEIGGENGTLYQLKQGVRSDFVLGGEYSEMKINNKTKGPLWLKVTATGKNAHGARLWEGENAIQVMLKFIDKVNRLLPVPKKEIWRTTQNLAKIETTNNTFNKVPDECTAWFDIRYVAEDQDTIVSQIKDLLLPGMTLSVSYQRSSQYTSPDHPFIKTLRQSAKKYLNTSPGFIGFHGATDLAHFEPYKIPGVCFGPLGGRLHSDNEWISLKSTFLYAQILEDFLISL